jgi:hypothetical protein
LDRLDTSAMTLPGWFGPPQFAVVEDTMLFSLSDETFARGVWVLTLDR